MKMYQCNVSLILVLVIFGCTGNNETATSFTDTTASSSSRLNTYSSQEKSSSTSILLTVPDSSASAITFQPENMTAINTQISFYGTGADSNIITLGPKTSNGPSWDPYPNKTSMEFELERGTPILAPLDMKMILFDNRNAEYRDLQDGQRLEPFDDLELCFESTSPEWPKMILCVYHLLSSPLLKAHNISPQCSSVESWHDTDQGLGHGFYEFDDYQITKGNYSDCDPLMQKELRRGDLIGFAGSVGNHSMAPFRFKVKHTSINPTVTNGDAYLHWVQPGSFFYWKCFATDAIFPPGVLAYPFECEGYELEESYKNIEFKY